MAIEIDKRAFQVPTHLAERGGVWPLPSDLQTLYQLPASQVNVGAMLEEVSRQLPQRMERARRRALESPGWGSFRSVKDFDDPSTLFEPVTGAIRIPHPSSLSPSSPFKDFYTKPGRIHIDAQGNVENRGARYYAIADHELTSPESKLQVMREDIADSLSTLRNVDRRNLSPDEFLLYLGVTDTLKQNLLSLFHALTFPERAGNHKPTRTYLRAKEVVWNLAKKSTRKHYQTLIGRDYDSHASIDIKDVDNVINFFQTTSPNVAQFKLQEIDHPLLIALSAHETALTYPDIDTIVAMPSGGTQLGIVTQLMFEIHPNLKAQHRHAPDLITVPLSTHSGKLALSNESFSMSELTKYIREHYARQVAGKKILVTEDNANRGKTAEMIHSALVLSKSKRVNVSLAELDPKRVIFKQQLAENERPADVINMLHPDFSTAIGTVPMKFVDGSDHQRRKLRAREVINTYRRV